jgi:glycosyltransferase involved in cell wall biosynthesis
VRSVAGHHIPVALANDYLTQRGGAERVAILMTEAFPGAPLYTTLYEPARTYDNFATVEVRPSNLNRISLLRRHHRLALPLLAPTVSSTRIDADVVLASSSGWVHGMQASGRKVVYCHAPARWLYQADRYLGGASRLTHRPLHSLPAAAALRVLRPGLLNWDVGAARSADRYLVNSTTTRLAVRDAYGIEAEVLAPPPALVPGGPEEPVAGVEPGALLCVARLLLYKNVDAVVAAVSQMPDWRLVVAGDGPERARLSRLAEGSGRITFVGRIPDAQLRWLYRECAALVAASYEDYGLSPLEAASFGKPTLALRAGGYLDTVIDGRTGHFFDEPTAESISSALTVFDPTAYSAETLSRHAATFSANRFKDRLRQVVAEEALKA